MSPGMMSVAVSTVLSGKLYSMTPAVFFFWFAGNSLSLELARVQSSGLLMPVAQQEMFPPKVPLWLNLHSISII